MAFYTGVLRMGDGRYYVRFRLPDGLTGPNGESEEQLAVQQAQALAALSGAVLYSVMKGIYLLEDESSIPSADPAFEYTAKLLIESTSGEIMQFQIPAVESSDGVDTWFDANKDKIYFPDGSTAKAIVNRQFPKQRAPRAS